MLLPFAFVLGLIAIDQCVKLWTLALPLMSYTQGYPYEGIAVFKDFFGIEFSLVHATNVGAAWSLFSNYSKELLFIRILLIIGLALYLISHKAPFCFRGKLPWILIFSGAVSNVIDHFLYAHVIDMFHFILWGYDYPVFNVADAYIFSGALLLVLNKGDRCELASKN